MDNIAHLEGKAVKTIEQNNSGLNSYLIVKFTDDSKLNISGYPHGDNGVAQLDIELNQIKLEEIKNRKILTIEEEFDGQMDKLHIKFKNGGEMVIGAFNSKEDGTAGLEITAYVENRKKLVGETLAENEYKDGRWGNYIMNSPQYEDISKMQQPDTNDLNKIEYENMIEWLDGKSKTLADYILHLTEIGNYETAIKLSKNLKENKNNNMKKFVKENLDESIQYEGYIGDEYDEYMDDIDGDDIDGDDIDPEDLYGDVAVSHGEKEPYERIDGLNVKDDESIEDEISYVPEVERRIDNLLKASEFNREPLEFKIKRSGEFIEGIPMTKLSGGQAVLFKTSDGGLRKVLVSDIVLESKKFKKWVGESLEDY